MASKKLMIIDGNSLIHRAFYALPPLKTKEGIVTNAVYGFLNMYYKVVEEYRPTHIGIVFDKKGLTFRHKEYEDYKAGRAKMPDELSLQFPLLKEILGHMNVKKLEIEGFEADDIAGTMASLGEREGYEVVLVSGDRDYLQLVDENTCVVLTKKGISDTEVYNVEKVADEYELTPEQLIDLKGLMGDSSDNIPGVPGVGPKTGIKLLKEYGSVENLYSELENMKKGSLKNKLELYRNQAYMSKMLARIVRNVPVETELDELKLSEPNLEELSEMYDKLEFRSLLEKIGGKSSAEEVMALAEKVEFKIISEKKELEGCLDSLKKGFYFKFAYEEVGGKKEILGISLVSDDKSYFYVDLVEGELDETSFFESFKPVAESKDIDKYGYDIKEEVISCLMHGVNLEGISYDAIIGMYLIDPSEGSYSAKGISREYLNEDILEIKDLVGTGKNKKSLKDIELEERAEFFVKEIKVISDTRSKIESTISEREMDELFYEVELPLATVLGDMQYRGFKVDIEELEKLRVDLDGKLEKLVSEIYEMAEGEFNINSPKQLSEILFEKLGLTPGKKTKTGYSTNAEVLEKLKGEHEIVSKILDYRQLSKLKSTYIDGMESVVDSRTHKVHSNFNQTITSTGRISSTEPNLQNIPIRTEEGRKIRKLFTSKSPEYKLVDADYSQIELRVLAHISDDEKLKEAFFENTDIHSKTASEVFGVPLESVTSELRGKAKAVNFGIVYGISDYGLSRDLNIPRKEAKEYIDNYFKNYPKVKEYMDSIVKSGKKKGYVETILNRRRYIPELSSRNFNIRGFGERIAMNTPIQGSAADIIKVAMIEVYRKLKEKNMRSRLILQVHDELIVEAHVDEVEDVKKLLSETMENAVKLGVPLKVDMEVGDNWYETK